MTWDPFRFSSFDLETHQVEDGVLAPRIVCGSTARFGEPGELLGREAAVEAARALLASDRVVCGANVAFDFGCLAAEDPSILPLVFRAYGEGRVFDVQVAQALHAIAEGNLYLDPRTGQPLTNPETGRRGRYSLSACVDLVLGRTDAKKNDYWRRRYALLDGVPQEDWPDDARQYPVDDAENTLAVVVAQAAGGGAGATPGPHRNLGDLADQCETAFCLHLGAMRGLRTDRAGVAALRRATEGAHAEFIEKFRALGFYDGDGKRRAGAVKRAVVLAYGGGAPCSRSIENRRVQPGGLEGVDVEAGDAAASGAACSGGKVLSEKTGNPINCPECGGTGLDLRLAPRTPAGGVRADRDALVESGDADLAALGDNEPEKILSTYLPYLESGVDRPISLRPNVLVASGRTSYDGLIQLLPRLGGVRECHRARGVWSGLQEDYVYCSVDFAALELCTLAQVCVWLFGQSRLADTINATGDPGMLHTAFAAKIAGVPVEEMAVRVKAKDPDAKKKRDVAKNVNFALPGGAGEARMVSMARGKGAGETVAPDGTVYPGIRYCVLIGGAERCGARKVTEWRDRPTPPICLACVELAAELREAWRQQWPEMRDYFQWVTDKVDAGGEFPCFASGRVRGGLDFTNGANNGFQALGSDAAKAALRELTRECYLDRGSPLWGTRPIFFSHDEVVAEMPLRKSALAGPRMARVMVDAAQPYLPDVRLKADPALMFRWYKNADMAFGAAGELVPWEPAA